MEKILYIHTIYMGQQAYKPLIKSYFMIKYINN